MTNKEKDLRRKLTVVQFAVSVGGVKRHILEFAEAFDRERLNIVGVFPHQAISSSLSADEDDRYKPEFERLGLPYHVLEVSRSLSPFHDLIAVARLFFLLRRIKPDIIHCHSSKAGYIGRAAAFLARVPGVCYTPHMIFYLMFTGFKRKLLLWAELFLSFFTDAIIAVSRSEKEQLKEDFGRFRDRIVVINNGICPEVKCYDAAETRRRYNLPENVPLLLSPARCEPQKDIKTLVLAMDRVRREVPNAILLVAGDGCLKPELEALSERLGLTTNIRFLGWVDHVDPLVALSEVVILSSMREGLPYVVLEASAIGKPVIGSNVMGTKDAIRDGETGYLVQQGDVEGFAERIVRLCRDPDLRKRMGEAGKKMVAENFSVTGMAKAMEDLYERIGGVETSHGEMNNERS